MLPTSERIHFRFTVLEEERRGTQQLLKEEPEMRARGKSGTKETKTRVRMRRGKVGAVHAVMQRGQGSVGVAFPAKSLDSLLCTVLIR